MTDRFLDDLGRSLARPMTRRRTVQVFLAGGAALALPPLRPRVAFAQDKPICWPETAYCNQITCQPGQTCCTGPLDPITGCPTVVGCCDPCNPRVSQCQGDGTCGPGPVGSQCCNGFCGKDCCNSDQDACCFRTFSSNPPHCCTGEQQHKDWCHDWQDALEYGAIIFGLAALIPGVGLAMAIVGGAGLLAAKRFEQCSNDPPDPHYKSLVSPTIPRVRVRAGNGLTRTGARAFNDLVVNTLRYGAYTFAWVRSIEKAQGAQRAGDEAWVQRHRVAAASYAQKAAAALNRDLKLRKAARRQAKRSGLRHLKVTAAQVRQWQHQVEHKGLPPEMERVLREAKLDRDSTRTLARELVSVDPKAVARVGIFGEVDDTRFTKANANMVKALKHSAQSLKTGGPLTV